MTRTISTQWLMAIALLICSAAQAHSGPVMHSFSQLLNHSDPYSPTWQQRYTVTSDWFTPGAGRPVFIFLSGEAPMEFFTFQTVQIRTWAEQYGALYINLEHRFYGQSMPMPSFATESLSHLSSEQALADAAKFITDYNSTLAGPASPWVIFGCSYSGGLSAWFRSEHPDLVVGAVAPSGPVVATLNYTSFFGQFSRSAEPACVDAAHTASMAIQSMVKTAAGRAALSKAFEACEPLLEEDVYYFLWTLMGSVGSADQMNNPPTWILNTTCDLLTNASDPVAGFAKAFAFNNGQVAATMADIVRRGVPLERVPSSTMLQSHSVRNIRGTCNDFHEANMTAQLKDPSNANRAWWFQKCNEFGYFKPGYDGTSPFFTNLPVGHIVQYCDIFFGIGPKQVEARLQATNDHYGGRNLAGTDIIFTNGLLDPWHLLSIYEPEGGVAAVTYEAGHCGPLIAATNVDPPSLVAARKRVDSFLRGVLQRFYEG